MKFPPLDCHAHVAVDVTDKQLTRLGESVVFAMTRSPEEAAEASRRWDRNLIWSCGAHPSFIARGGVVDLKRFASRSARFAVVGEVGLDRPSGNLEVQRVALEGILKAIRDQPVLVSIHSAGCSGDIVDVVRQHHRTGLIMHWFSGSPAEARSLVDLGCYFSVNGATRRDLVESLPLERVLPETDFPVAKKGSAARPGDTEAVEQLLADLHGGDSSGIRVQFYRNLRHLSVESGAIDRMPDRLVDLLLVAV